MSVFNESPTYLRQRLFHRGRKFNFDVHSLRLHNGVEGDWECIRHRGGALAVLITSKGELVLVKQYRFAVRGRLLEFPAGTLKPNEEALETIKHEIQEETGYCANTWHSLGKLSLAPGYSDEYIYVFLARDLEKLDHPPKQDKEERTEVVLMTFSEFETALLKGEPIDAKSLSSFLMTRLFLDKING
ncbi:MAG: NUDIX hydrolase [cyanobacterium endosymbiont of Rhopalodia musculus]|uniref:NUDIX hydrolase n=1 Tax=cyanobacterium endosymbiont of Epithemia clementina EcSB TaxID=3034674 RepID=UPI002480E73E|nr:NUDIX hydrolase [cyanobacterium endosymbiont of Epithemia clementina EcSB]WGT66797.1 NUDIX hydrolase [cyanobacterium endosymbiont of Epithemia clementina EcSB]